MSDQTTAGDKPASTDASAVTAILAEYEIFKKNYAKDSLVQAMAAQLARLAGLSPEVSLQVAYPQDEAPAEIVPVNVVSAMSGYLRRCSSGGMPQDRLDVIEAAVAQAQDLGYFSLLRAPAAMDGSDVERLLYAGRVLRAIADECDSTQVGDLWGEIVTAAGAIKRVLGLKDEDCTRLGLLGASMLPPGGKSARTMLLEGWKEAVIAWEVCASIHRAYGKGKDALFKTRQADYVRHTDTARAHYLALAGITQDTSD
jgi:hypothetical protein